MGDDLSELTTPRPRWESRLGARSWSAPEQGCKTNGQKNVIGVGIIGYGYWGPNIVRCFHGLANCRVVAVCDANPTAIARVLASYPGVEVTSDARDMFTSKIIDAVAVVTPVTTHYELARLCLENGKHVFVEKPFTATIAQAEELITLAEQKRLKIMVDHTFLFTGAVRKIKELIDQKELGPLYYYDSVRINLGPLRHDVNVIWDLASHDLSIMDYLIDERPAAVIATGASYVNCQEDVAYITVYFANNFIGHINVNWLAPVKVRTTRIVGGQRMLVWNELEAEEKIKIYDKGITVTDGDVYDLLTSYRSGDIWSPRIDQTEALKLEAEHFVDCILHDKKPFNDGEAGLRVVRLLAAANLSLRKRGQLINLHSDRTS
jgi:predicted dehydrogenase